MIIFRNWAIAVAMVLVGLTPNSSLAKTGCTELRDACEAAGFVGPGGRSKGILIVRDCMTPLISGAQPPGEGKLALPTVSEKTIEDCKALKARAGKAQSAPRGRQAPGAKPGTVNALPAGVDPGPNIVLILLDDFSMNLMPDDVDVLAETMPNLARMRRDGMTFDQYFVTNSLCCPSRATIFTGLLPHNSGVLGNTAPDGGFVGYNKNGNPARSFAVALHDAHYATAMMGKYLNGYRPEINGVPEGWSEWAVAGNAYANYDYTINHNGDIIAPEQHMTDELSALGQAFIANASGGPFFLELSTFSPHAPYTPPRRYADAFPGLTHPRTPAFGARPDDAAPQWLKDIPPLENRAKKRIDEIFRLRVQSVMGVDDMIGAIRKTLDDLGLASDTYIIFTSDNGYHLGEYSLRAGKKTPFDTDIHVPLVVVGPGIPAGSRNDDFAMNIDLYPTFLDMAGLVPSPDVDGQSLLPAILGGQGPTRTLAPIEHTRTPQDASDPDTSEPKAGDPPSYIALRFRDTLYVEYLDGSEDVGFYDMSVDPYQLHNMARGLGPGRLKALHDAAMANLNCSGAAECGAAQQLAP